MKVWHQRSEVCQLFCTITVILAKKKKYNYVHTHTLMQESWLLTNDKSQLFSGNLRISSVSTERAVPAQPHPTRSGAKRPITTKWIRLISPIYNVQCPIQTLIFEIKEKQKAVYVHWWCKITKIYLTFASLQKRWCFWGQWSYSCFASASMPVLFLLLFFFIFFTFSVNSRFLALCSSHLARVLYE